MLSMLYIQRKLYKWTETLRHVCLMRSRFFFLSPLTIYGCSIWEHACYIRVFQLMDVAHWAVRREGIRGDCQGLLVNDYDKLLIRFRFPRAVLLELCAELQPLLERHTTRTHALPVPVQVPTMLGFLATRDLPKRAGRPIDAGCVRRNHLYVNQVISSMIRATLKRRLQREQWECIHCRNGAIARWVCLSQP